MCFGRHPLEVVLFTLAACFALSYHNAEAKPTVKLGVIVEADTGELQAALVAALRQHRLRQNVPFVLEPAISVISTVNVFKISRLICDKVFSLGSHIMLGHVQPEAFDTIHSYANTFQIPFVAPWFPQKVRRTSSSLDFALSTRPEYHEAILDVMDHYQWTNIVFMYDSEDGLHRLQQLMQQITPEMSLHIRVEHAHKIFSVQEAINFLLMLESKNRWSAKRIVLDCSSEMAQQIIKKHVSDIRLGRRTYHYLLSSLAMDSWKDETSVEFGAVNITGFRLLDPESPLVRKVNQTWQASETSLHLTARTALMYDSLLVIEAALQQLWSDVTSSPAAQLLRKWSSDNLTSLQMTANDKASHEQVLASPVFDCSHGFPKLTHYSSGGRIMKQLRKVEIEGLTGNISFSQQGKRHRYKLDVIEINSSSQHVKIGEWTDSRGLQVKSSPFTQGRTGNQNLKRKNTLIVSTIEEEPFIRVLRGNRSLNRTGNDRYMGYCKDLVELLARKVGFKYEIRLVKDGKYGAVNDTRQGNWDGIIGELIRQEADLAVAPLTISLEREQVVAFTKPFMSLGISIMIKKPISKNPGIFSFLNPLSSEVWLCVVFAYLGVSIVFFLVGRFSPFEWQNSRTVASAGTPTRAAAECGLFNSLWFTLAALLQQGGDFSPRSVSGRLAGACWWFFCLVLVSSYTANLAAFLTVERLVTPISSVSDLAAQERVQYGTLAAGSTAAFFQNSKIGVYQRMWDYMSTTAGVFVETYEEGIQRVRASRGKYALLIESTKNDYVNERLPCDTMKVGRHLDSKGYGVATNLHSPWRAALNLAVLTLKENGELAKLQNKWWFTNSECKKSKESEANELLLNNVAGVFYILIAGLVLAMAAALVEFCWRSRLEAKQSKSNHLDAMRSRAQLTISGPSVADSSKIFTTPKEMENIGATERNWPHL